MLATRGVPHFLSRCARACVSDLELEKKKVSKMLLPFLLDRSESCDFPQTPLRRIQDVVQSNLRFVPSFTIADEEFIGSVVKNEDESV